MSLAELEAQIERDLELLAYPARSWTPARPGSYDVVIIGAGQGGLAAGFGLWREGIKNILVVDQAPPGQEGPWGTFARMPTLRTPKALTGPDLGIPSLTWRSWFEAQYGPSAWEKLHKVPTDLWLGYLNWFRKLLNIPVENNFKVSQIIPRGDHFLLRGPQEIPARRVVLANGIEGSGQWQIPEFILALPKEYWAHTSEAINFDQLAEKQVGVLGAGASAFDNASCALEAGANEVHLFFRRNRLPRVNPHRWMEFPGFLAHAANLSDLWRWRFMRQILTQNQPPPPETYQRARSHSNFYLHSQSPWLEAGLMASRVWVRTPSSRYEFDYLIIGTGLVVDLTCRPELSEFCSEIALWQDRFTPPADEAYPPLGLYPYLGSHFEFKEKIPGQAPYLNKIFNFNYGALASLGLSGSSISAMRYAVPRLVRGISQSLFVEDASYHYQDLLNYQDQELKLD